MVHTYSIIQRVLGYTIPVVIFSILLNIPKFLETRLGIFVHQEVDEYNNPYNVTDYGMETTELR